MPNLGTVAKPLLLEFRNAWSRQIRALYKQQFQGKCPRTLSNLQTLTFLPKVLHVHVPWSLLEVQTVANSCGVPIVCFAGSRHALANTLATSSEFNHLCQQVLQYRLEKKHDCCTTLRHITTWNVSGWRTVQWTHQKSRAIHRAARKGIVCLQETRWSDSTAANFLQNYPGYDVSHTPATVTDNGGLSGGVAILIPCGFRLVREEVILPSKIIAAYVQSRSDSYWVISFFVLVRICFDGILLIVFPQNILAQVGLLICWLFSFFGLSWQHNKGIALAFEIGIIIISINCFCHVSGY